MGQSPWKAAVGSAAGAAGSVPFPLGHGTGQQGWQGGAVQSQPPSGAAHAAPHTVLSSLAGLGT